MANLICRSFLRRSLHIAAPQFRELPAAKVASTSVSQLDPELKAPKPKKEAFQVPKPITTPDPAYVSSIIKQDFFGLKDLYTIEDLMKSRVHFGHKDTMLNEYMRPYIFGKRLGVTIIDLDQTDKMLKYALNVTAEIAYREGIILFIHQSRQTGYMVEAAAKECNEYAFCRRWIGSVLTNAQTTFGAVTRLPDLIIIIGCNENVNDTHRAVKMAAKMLIPTVGICDTNSDPSLVTYPVPGNDDSPQSIELYCNLFKKAIMAGKTKRIADDGNGDGDVTSGDS